MGSLGWRVLGPAVLELQQDVGGLASNAVTTLTPGWLALRQRVGWHVLACPGPGWAGLG